VVALASVGTFAGGVMTRRAEIARAPGEEPPARALSLKPVVATLRRWGGELTGNAAAIGRNARAHLGFGEANEGKRDAGEPARVATLSAVHTETQPATKTTPPGETPPEPTPVAAKPEDAKPEDAKPEDAKPAEATPTEPKPAKATPKKAATKKATPKPVAPTTDTPPDTKLETDGQSERDEEPQRPAAPGSGA
jgi:cell division septation protein DedD